MALVFVGNVAARDNMLHISD